MSRNLIMSLQNRAGKGNTFRDTIDTFTAEFGWLGCRADADGCN